MDLPLDQHEEASYIIFKKDGDVFARNGDTGNIEFSGTDAATVIQNALNAIGQRGMLFVKGEGYEINSQITIPGNDFTIAGEGMWWGGGGAEQRTFYAGSAIPSFFALGGDYKFITFKDMSFDGNSNADRGIDLTRSENFAPNDRLVRVAIRNCNNYGIYENYGDGSVITQSMVNNPIRAGASGGTIRLVNGNYRRVEAFGQQLVLANAATQEIVCPSGEVLQQVYSSGCYHMNPTVNTSNFQGDGRINRIAVRGPATISNNHDGQTIIGGSIYYGGEFKGVNFFVPSSGTTVTFGGGSAYGGNPPIFRVYDSHSSGSGTFQWQPATPVHVLDVRNWNNGTGIVNSGLVQVVLDTVGVTTTTVTYSIPYPSGFTPRPKVTIGHAGAGRRDWDGMYGAADTAGDSFTLWVNVTTALDAGEANYFHWHVIP